MYTMVRECLLSFLLLYLLHSTRPSTSVLSEYGQRREIVEDADFEALEWKLRGCTVSP